MKRSIFSVPIEVTVTVGSARPLIGELLSMGRDHLLPLDSGIDDPVELRVKDRVIARGELTQSNEGDGRLGIRLTEIVELTDIIP
ncbi:MAG: FliM/FliN family flagellar motor switch protein [Pseudomonadota bacterium]